MARFVDRNWQAHFVEYRPQSHRGGDATVIHHGAGPIENNGGQAHETISMLLAVRSARPKDRVIPEPPGAVTMLTPGAGWPSKKDRSGCRL